MKIIRIDYCPATKDSVDDVPRYVVKAELSRSETSRESVMDIAKSIVSKLKEEHGYFAAATVFFWLSCEPVGYIPAKASITYGPKGSWDEAINAKKEDMFSGFEFAEDFYNFCETCWANPA